MAPFKKSLKRVAKRVYTKGKSLAKARYAPKGKINYNKIAADAAKLVKLMNVEKKYTFNTQNQRGFAQLDYNAQEVTPTISQGITGTTRNGNSVKLVSARLDIQIKAQVSLVNAFKYKYYLVCKPDRSSSSAATVATQLLDVNIFSGVIDYHSQRDPEFFRNYRVICSGQGTIQPDSLSGQTGIVQFHRNLKLNHHLKYDSDATDLTTTNGMYMILLGDTGDQTLATGVIADYSIRYWYVDN